MELWLHVLRISVGWDRLQTNWCWLGCYWKEHAVLSFSFFITRTHIHRLCLTGLFWSGFSLDRVPQNIGEPVGQFEQAVTLHTCCPTNSVKVLKSTDFNKRQSFSSRIEKCRVVFSWIISLIVIICCLGVRHRDDVGNAVENFSIFSLQSRPK